MKQFWRDPRLGFDVFAFRADDASLGFFAGHQEVGLVRFAIVLVKAYLNLFVVVVEEVPDETHERTTQLL